MPELYDLTVADAEERIRKGELTSVALAESLLGRIDMLEPTLKAWTTIDREELLGVARESDIELEKGGPRGPLHGIPVGLKDIFYTKGMKTTAGSKIYADFIPTYDATTVARLKVAGRRHPRQGCFHRVRFGRRTAHSQSLEPGPYPRRLQYRLVGGRGCSHVSRRPG